MSKDKKTLQLGMNPSTASGRLVKDLLFDFVQKSGTTCYQCGGELTRETFSVEHKEPWLDSEDPVGLYFDLENISYSHLSCNIGTARQPVKGVIKHGTSSGYDHYGCRCGPCKEARKQRTPYDSENRKEKYRRTGN